MHMNFLAQYIYEYCTKSDYITFHSVKNCFSYVVRWDKIVYKGEKRETECTQGVILSLSLWLYPLRHHSIIVSSFFTPNANKTHTHRAPSSLWQLPPHPHILLSAEIGLILLIALRRIWGRDWHGGRSATFGYEMCIGWQQRLRVC